jgi:toxin ParE1/3/4
VKRIGFHPEARRDLTQAAERYAAAQTELGRQFYHHIDGLLTDITHAPGVFRVFQPPQVRRHFKRRFPYAVVYVERPEEIWVLAVMHFKQAEGYWLHRLA